jgi:hypothetical protein
MLPAALCSRVTPLVHSVESFIRGWLGEGLERQGSVRDVAQEYRAGKEMLAASAPAARPVRAFRSTR